jgi:hypothetical protein
MSQTRSIDRSNVGLTWLGQFSFPGLSDLSGHRMSVNCGYCDEQFINNVQFIAHVKAVHVNEHDYAADEAFEVRSKLGDLTSI